MLYPSSAALVLIDRFLSTREKAMTASRKITSGPEHHSWIELYRCPLGLMKLAPMITEGPLYTLGFVSLVYGCMAHPAYLVNFRLVPFIAVGQYVIARMYAYVCVHLYE